MSNEHGIIHSRSQGFIDYAYAFAKKAHEGQVRRYTDEPYIVHPVAVAKAVATVTDDCDMIAAALLHDVVEDCDVTFGDLYTAEFGFRAIGFVKELTEFSKSNDGNRAFRKELDRRYLSRVTPQSKTIKLADMIHNSVSIIEHSKGFAPIYIGEMELLLCVLKEGDATLWKQANAICLKYRYDKKFNEIEV